MKPTVLLYNFTDSKRKMNVQQALMPLGFRLRAVKKEEYGLPVGVLAGVKGLEEELAKAAKPEIKMNVEEAEGKSRPKEAEEKAEQETRKEESAQKQADERLQQEGTENDSSRKMDFSDEMAIMAGFSSAQIDAFIYALRKKGVGRIDYKAVLTPYNMKWDSVQLYEEIKKEHEAMTGKTMTEKM